MVSAACCIVSFMPGREVWAGGVARTICGALSAIVIFFFTKAHIIHLDMLRRMLSFRRYLVAGIALLGIQLSSVASGLVLDVSRRTNNSRIAVTAQSAYAPTACQLGSRSALPAGYWPLHHDAVVPHVQSERLVCLVQITLALACMVVASMSTYGVSGYVLHRYTPHAESVQRGKHNRSACASWTFFQPFKVCNLPQTLLQARTHSDARTFKCI